MNYVARYFGEVKQELLKVSWPKRETVVYHTITVIVAMALSVLILAGIDYLFSKLANLILVGNQV